MVQEVAKERMGKVMESDHGGVVLEREVVVGEGEEELEEEDNDDLVLPGFRFHPTDEELVTFYLRRKVAGKRLSIEIIREMDIYKHEPWDFPKASTTGGEEELYFFCLRGRKYRNSIRPNRVTGAGFWKATGIDRPIHSAGRGDYIGLKKSLVYYRGSAGKGTKTEWMMHEFRLPPRPNTAADTSPCLQEAEVWTICRIFKRNITYKKQPQQVAVAAAPHPDSSSITGSLESDCTGDEYINCLQAPQAPVNNVNNGYGGQNSQGQWKSAVQPAAPQPLPAMAAFHPSVLSPAAPNDGCWDDIGRMVMELTDPSLFYDCRYAC